MADTIAEAVAGGWKAGVDMQNYGKQEEAQTSLLSSKAEAAKEEMAAYKQGQITNMAARASILNSRIKMGDKYTGDLQSQIQGLQGAIKAESNPEVQSKLQEDLKGLYTSQKTASESQIALQTEQQATRYDAFRQAAATGDYEGLAKSEDPFLQKLSKLYNNTPLPMAGGLTYQQAVAKDPSFADKFNREIEGKLAPSNVKSAQGIVAGYQKSINNNQVQEDAIAQRERDSIRRAAAAQAKLELEKKKKEAGDLKARDKTVQLAKLETEFTTNVNKVEDKMNKLLIEEGVEKPTEMTDHWYGLNSTKMSPAGRTAFDNYIAQKNRLEASYNKSKELLQAGNQIVLPKEDPLGIR